MLLVIPLLKAVGLTEGYGNVTPIQTKVAGEHFSQVLTGMEPDTIYHFRALAHPD
ncbi:MAG: hypothetical protein ACE5LA_06505 [Dehalococcoidales bacterium]